MTTRAAACVVLLGPPGAGKGTQAGYLASDHGFAVVASGELLRSHVARGSVLGRQARTFMDRGDLVPEHLMTSVVVDGITEVLACGTRSGLVLDGYPKSRFQAEALDEVLARFGIRSGLAIHLRVTRDVAARRLLERGRQSGRSDDVAEVIQRRLDQLGDVPADLLGYYDNQGRLHVIDGEQGADAVRVALTRAIDVTG